jgi:hypothetical protein
VLIPFSLRLLRFFAAETARVRICDFSMAAG